MGVRRGLGGDGGSCGRCEAGAWKRWDGLGETTSGDVGEAGGVRGEGVPSELESQLIAKSTLYAR